MPLFSLATSDDLRRSMVELQRSSDRGSSWYSSRSSAEASEIVWHVVWC